MEAKKVRITVLRKTFNQDFVDAYTEGYEWRPSGCCHDFAIGQEFFSDGHMPDGFSDWAWTDIQKYVVVSGPRRQHGRCQTRSLRYLLHGWFQARLLQIREGGRGLMVLSRELYIMNCRH